jgi:hypothetical protein
VNVIAMMAGVPRPPLHHRSARSRRSDRRGPSVVPATMAVLPSHEPAFQVLPGKDAEALQSWEADHFARRGINPFCDLANSACCQRRCSHTSSKSSAARSQEPGHHRPRGWWSSQPHGGTLGTRLTEWTPLRRMWPSVMGSIATLEQLGAIGSTPVLGIPRMGGLGQLDTAGAEPLEPGITVDLNGACELRQMRSRTLGPTIGTVEIDGRRIRSIPGPVITGIDPEPAGFGAATARIKHREPPRLPEGVRLRLNAGYFRAHSGRVLDHILDMCWAPRELCLHWLVARGSAAVEPESQQRRVRVCRPLTRVPAGRRSFSPSLSAAFHWQR